MHSSYSLHIPKKVEKVKRRRKRKVIPIISHQYNSYKYICYSCGAEVYFLPGHELVCSKCASRTVEQINFNGQKREFLAR